MGLLCGLAGFVVLLVGVAIVGHMLWLAGAAVFGGSEPARHCPVCGGSLASRATRCAVCGCRIVSAKPNPDNVDDELDATRRQLHRLMMANKISGATWEKLLEAIRADVRERALAGFSNAVRADVLPPVAEADEMPLSVSTVAESAVELAPPTPAPHPQEILVPAPWESIAAPLEPAVAPIELTAKELKRPRELASILQAFMEEKNIRWGELISGLLIVGSSVGLVISLWATLKEAIPYFPVAVFLTATAAMHGAGLYTLKRWRLKSTSRGLLLVSTLLIPLNVLAAMVLNEKQRSYGAIDYGAFAIGLSILAALAASAARVLNRRNPWPMVAAVVGTAVGMSTIGRLARPGAGFGPEMGRTLGLFALPFFSFLAGAIAHVVSLSRGRRLTVRRVAQSFRFFGIAGFGLVLAGGFLASKCGDVRETLTILSPMLAAVAATLTGAGLIVHRRVTKLEEAGFRIAGTSIALGGGLLSLLALALAWPRPDLLVTVGLLDAVALTLLAWFAAFPALNVFATLSFSLAFLVGFEWALGEISILGATSEGLAHLLLTARSALLLALLSLAIDAAGCGLGWLKSRAHAAAYFTSALAHQALAVLVAAGAVWRDVPDQDLATAVFALLVVRWLVAMWWINRRYAGLFAATLLLAALGHGLAMNDDLAARLGAHGLCPVDPWTMSLLVHATICLGCAAFARRGREAESSAEMRENALVTPLTGAAIVTSALAVPMLLDLRQSHFLTHGVYAFWAAGIWFAAAFLRGYRGLAIASQILATIGITLGVTGFCHRQLWWTGRFADPLFLNWQFGAQAAWSGLSIVARRVGQRIGGVARVFKSEPTSVDRILLGGVVSGLVVTCLMAAWPGIIAELSSISSCGNGRLYLEAVLLPFGVGAVLAAAGAVFPRQWQRAAGIVVLVCLINALALSGPNYMHGWSWLGLPTPYGRGWGAGAWPALLLALVALGAAYWERPNRATLTGIALVLSAVPYLVACRYDADLKTATALRWTSAIAGLVVAAAWGSGGLFAGLARKTAEDMQKPAREQLLFLRNSLIAATSLPVLILTSQALIDVLGAARIPSAPPNGPFAFWMTAPLTDTVPLGLLAATFVLYSSADRSPLWGLSATFLIQIALGFAVGLSLVTSRETQSLAEITRYLEEMGLLTVIAGAVWCAIELVLSRRVAQSGPQVPVPPTSSPLGTPIQTQLGFAAVIVLLLTIGATAGLWLSPEPLFNSVRQYGSSLGWILLASTAVLWAWDGRGAWPRSAINTGLAVLTAAAVMGGASLNTLHTADNWLSLHTTLVGWCAVVGLTAFAGVATGSGERRAGALRIADRTLLLIPAILLFAAKAELLDPQRPWWSAGAMVWLSLCVTAIAVGAESRRRSYLSLLLAFLAAAAMGLRPWLKAAPPLGWQPVVDLVDIIILGIGLHGLVWLAINLRHERVRERPFAETSNWLPVHHAASAIGTFSLGLTTLVVLLTRERVGFLTAATPVAWGALGAMTVLAAGSLWERRAGHPIPILYALGLTAIATFLDSRQLVSRNLIFAAAAAASGYIVLGGLLWSVRRPLKRVGLRLGLTPFATDGERIDPWLGPVSLAIAALVIGVEFWVVLTFPESPLRICGAVATLAVAGGLSLLATSRMRGILQSAALAVGAIAAVQFGWSLMEPIGSAAHEELRRTIRMLAMLAATTFVYGLPLVRLAPTAGSWFVSIRRAAISVAATTIATLALVLLFEIGSFDPTAGTPVTLSESLLVATTLVLLAAGLVSLAVLPGQDPFFQSDRQRFLYVYASEAVCGLLFAHLYLTHPQFFRHTLQPYWPLVVMAIAYCGTAVSELFRRWKVAVLAEPLEYSAAFLPVLPVIGFWFLGSDLSYSTMLVVAGLLYLFLSLRRGSFAYAAAAAVVGNATLLSLFSEHGVSLFLHPQMFIIPPCVTILAAAQINRERLDPTVLASLRYFAITLIYVSSTGEMFQHGIGTTLWLPMVLAGLSVLGVLAGIVLRVRAFLYLGTSFLLLSIVSMVWHAARSIGHVWPWWVFLFALGVGLLTVFGVFEKKRPEVLALVGSLSEWER